MPNVEESTKETDNNDKIAVLVFSCNRPDAIRNHLDQLIAVRKATVDVEKFPIIVSQDCGHQETAKAIEKYSEHLFDYMKVINSFKTI